MPDSVYETDPIKTIIPPWFLIHIIIMQHKELPMPYESTGMVVEDYAAWVGREAETHRIDFYNTLVTSIALKYKDPETAKFTTTLQKIFNTWKSAHSVGDENSLKVVKHL